MKIRGTAQHVAEKYLQLARDAQSSGDPVAAENLLQHAEHYFRIIASAQAAQQQAQMGYGRNGEEFDEGDDDDDFVALPDRFASPFERAPQNSPVQPPQQNGGQIGYGSQPQPYFDRPAFNTESNERPIDRQERQERNFERGPSSNGERQERQPRNDRRFGQQGERASGDRQQGQGRNRFRDQQPRFDSGPSSQEQPRVDFEPMTSALPAFITAPTRIPNSPSISGANGAPSTPAEGEVDSFGAQPVLSPQPPEHGVAPSDDESENRFHLRPRRRRRVRSDSATEGGDATPQPETSSAD